MATRRKKSASTGKRPSAGKDQLAQTILNSLSAHVAILDENGFILETNHAWMQFAEANQIRMRPDTLRVNYLDICDSADGYSADESSSVAQGIRDVIAGRIEEFVLDYPCHSPDEKRWFYMRVTRAAGPGAQRIVVSHENITALKLAEERLRQSENNLWQEKQKLEDANTALKVLLQQREKDQRQMEADVLDNVRRLIIPLVERLKGQTFTAGAAGVLATVEKRLEELTQPFLRRLSNAETVLTPQEIEVAALIREGRSSKEIAALLHLSLTTINFHRRNLRRKLNLRNSRINLRTYLLSLTE
ncbi:MAG: LuxR C-terminal-related transcriptional regulator [Desulfobacterales bacterium]|nr:LuxR C-terminal-related transcriptional regulator [Desulfobacterales bacterium]MDJ0889431.1 LuxR C-terminal-related transcriptional regulator [Desulfobacterales bacterium]